MRRSPLAIAGSMHVIAAVLLACTDRIVDDATREDEAGTSTLAAGDDDVASSVYVRRGAEGDAVLELAPRPVSMDADLAATAVELWLDGPNDAAHPQCAQPHRAGRPYHAS